MEVADGIVKEFIELLAERRLVVDNARTMEEEWDRKVREKSEKINLERAKVKDDVKARVQELISERKKVLPQNGEVAMLQSIRKALARRIRSSTKELCAGKSLASRRYGQSVEGYRIVIGNFGFGIREQKQSRPLRSDWDVRFLLANLSAVIAKLRDMKLVQEAELLEGLGKLMPDQQVFTDEGMLVPTEPVSFFDSEGRKCVAKAFSFTYWGTTIVCDVDRYDKPRHIDCLPDSNDGYVVWVQVHKGLDKALEDAKGYLVALEVQMGKSVDECVGKIEEHLGRWLLLGSL